MVKCNYILRLAQKLRTPLTATKQKSIFSLKPKIFAIQADQTSNEVNEAPNIEQKKSKNKKRNAKTADISVIL